MVSLLLLLLLFYLSLSFTHSKMLGCSCLCVDDIYNYIDIYINAPRKCNTKRETYINAPRKLHKARDIYIWPVPGLIVSCRRKDIVSPTNLCGLLQLSCQLLLRVKVHFSPHVY